MTKIGVFDSGIGGLSVAGALQKGLPGAKVIFLDDHDNLPYGNKTKSELLQLVLPRLIDLRERGCELIVIACNTVTTNCIAELRALMQPLRLVGIEPMVKPASLSTRSKIIAVCATDATKSSQRYQQLKQEYGQDITVLEPDCSEWATMIERSDMYNMHLEEVIDAVCDAGADVIVLGCTHYHWISERIQEITKNRALVIHPEDAIVSRVKELLLS
jgi:glutamate racemase